MKEITFKKALKLFNQDLTLKQLNEILDGEEQTELKKEEHSFQQKPQFFSGQKKQKSNLKLFYEKYRGLIWVIIIVIIVILYSNYDTNSSLDLKLILDNITNRGV